MIRKFSISVFFILVFCLYLMPQQTDIVFACSYGEIENWWYHQNYEFDSHQFPNGISLEIVYEHSVIGEFYFSNASDNDLFLIIEPWFLEWTYDNPSSLEKVSQNTLDELSVRLSKDDLSEQRNWDNWFLPKELFPASVWKNQDSPGGIKEEAPEPQNLELLFINDGLLQSVPFTISYSKNETYNPNMVVPPSTISERTIASNAIVEGVATSATNEVFEGLILDSATFTVNRWLKGSGPDEIKVESFGFGLDCRPELLPDTPIILFLGDQLDEQHYQLIGGTWYFEKVADPNVAPEIIETVGRPPIIMPSATSVQDTLVTTQKTKNEPIFLPEETGISLENGEAENSEPFENISLKWILTGSTITMIVLVIIFIWYRKREINVSS